MRKALFPYAEKIVADEKYFDIGRGDIVNLLVQKGECEFVTEHDVTDENGDTTTTELKLNVATRAEMPECWSISLKLHGMRIDCIDYEGSYRTATGERASGWHRHKWSNAQDSAEKNKIPVPALSGFTNRDEFLIRALGEMKIRVNKNDHGPSFLPLD